MTTDHCHMPNAVSTIDRVILVFDPEVTTGRADHCCDSVIYRLPADASFADMVEATMHGRATIDLNVLDAVRSNFPATARIGDLSAEAVEDDRRQYTRREADRRMCRLEVLVTVLVMIVLAKLVYILALT